VDIVVEKDCKRIGVTRVHMEEDAASRSRRFAVLIASLHRLEPLGVPLIELSVSRTCARR